MAILVPLIEIFSSFQGEGPRIGERHTFVRFQDCEFSCGFCDTPLSFVPNKYCRVESPPFSKKTEKYLNPIGAEQLNLILEQFKNEVISVTGGEPLQKKDFLQEWLPTLGKNRKVLLETAGIHHEALDPLLPYLHIISMDLKLPSSTGMKPYWEEHRKFLKKCISKESYVKVVTTSETTDEDVKKAVELVQKESPFIPFILQPASKFSEFDKSPSWSDVARWQEIASGKLKNVRVISQMHKQMGVL